MKLACDSCHAKYSVADERVVGKTFKFRCKKCSHVIVLRGTTAPLDTPPPESGAWHAVVGGEQSGPFDSIELARRREAGELDDDALVWREGMADWAALGTVDELRAQPSPETAVEIAEATRLRNERNETSVLFTLGNLQKLAAEPRPAPTSSTSATTREEGSGLIDIRALASTWASPATRSSPATALDELPASTGIADPIVLVPTPSRRGVDRRLVFALIAMLATIVTLGTVLVVVLTRDGGTAQAAVPPPPVTAVVPVSVPVPVAVVQPPAPPPPPAPVVEPQKPTQQPVKVAKAAKVAKVAKTPAAPKEEALPSFLTEAPPPPPSNLPDNLDRAAFMKGISTFDAQKCGASSSAKGDVNVSIKITAEGKVSGVTIKSTPDPALGTCVEREAKRGTFAKTKRGGSYAYVWRF
jgi:predicted Zn finger-like uncharacterized protein